MLEKEGTYFEWAKKSEKGAALFIDFCSFLEKKKLEKAVQLMITYFSQRKLSSYFLVPQIETLALQILLKYMTNETA